MDLTLSGYLYEVMALTSHSNHYHQFYRISCKLIQ
jgi:hypothetical protein